MFMKQMAQQELTRQIIVMNDKPVALHPPQMPYKF
jgi:hypothetical protein